ncbi:MAG: hypothetical protein L3J33_01590 [Rhodobacteraceae bacterium]|nr:hypothetical protein [Paracoccaceae bacterium]
MIKKIKHLWQEHRLLLLGFIIASLFTIMFLIRTIFDTVYFQNNRDRPIEPWMPIGYIAKTYDVPPEVLLQSAGIPLDNSIRRRIRRVAQETGIPYEQLVAQLMDAIEQHRAMAQQP